MFESLLGFLFPENCCCCHTGTAALCTSCIDTIPLAPRIKNAFALYSYTHPIVRNAIHQLKYHRKSSVAKRLIFSGIPLAKDHIDTMFPNKQIVFVPIPQYISKTLSRGFNQSTIIGKILVKAFPGAILKPVLKKTRATKAQALTESRSEREINLQGSMSAKTTLDPHILYIVLDDVITTGSTITEASRALRAAGAKHIYAIALAHG